MTGFYGGGKDRLEALLNALERTCSGSFLVGREAIAKRQPRLSAERPMAGFGDRTRLDKALSYWLASPSRRLVLVTDNVADGGDPGEQQAQGEFYRLLRESESRITHLSMLILRPPFSGPVYPLGRGKPNSYTGYRALSLYVIERGGPREAGNEEFLKQIEQVVKTQGYRRYRGAGKPDRADYAVARLSPFNPGIDPDDNSMNFSVEDGGRHVSILDNGTIDVRRGGSDRETRFIVSKLKISTGPDWDFGKAPFVARVHFPADPQLGAALVGKCTVNPQHTQPGLNQNVEVAIECVIPPVWASLTGEQRRKLALSEETIRQGVLELAVEARNTQLTLKGPLQRHFGMAASAESDPQALARADGEIQERVYKLPALLERIIPANDRIVVIKRFPLQVNLAHSSLELLGQWIGRSLPLLAGLLGLAVIVWAFSRPASYTLSGTKSGAPVMLPFGRRKSVEMNDGTRVELSLVGPAILVQIGKQRSFLPRWGGKLLNAQRKSVGTLSPMRSERRRNTANNNKRGRGRGRQRSR